MTETFISVSLHDGTLSKVFTADVAGSQGQPLEGVEVVFVLDGEGSLAADKPLTRFGRSSDTLGHASVSFNRLRGENGDLSAVLRAQCLDDVRNLRLRLFSMTADHSRR